MSNEENHGDGVRAIGFLESLEIIAESERMLDDGIKHYKIGDLDSMLKSFFLAAVKLETNGLTTSWRAECALRVASDLVFKRPYNLEAWRVLLNEETKSCEPKGLIDARNRFEAIRMQ